MKILSKIFGNNCPTEPSKYIVTRWHLDPFAYGCYSYMKNGSLPEDYDKLAEPLYIDNKKDFARVFFAGEHTIKQYPSSVHGAFLSGLREAGRIADIFIGPLSPLGGEINDEGNDENNCIDGQGILAFECQNQLNIKENKPGSSNQNNQNNYQNQNIAVKRAKVWVKKNFKKRFFKIKINRNGINKNRNGENNGKEN
ncbi:unnamed protein product [Meloidogyne enterolobii]|uniref:Uncharacterized protein n=1 Tax=Meloidogyne enterolobii TaxID=390850 RepID=A0ACB0XNP8_MELEN